MLSLMQGVREKMKRCIFWYGRKEMKGEEKRGREEEKRDIEAGA